MKHRPQSVSASQAGNRGAASQRRAVLSAVSLKILLQITVLHVLGYDARSWITAMMTSDHHAQQTHHVRVIQTTKCGNFSLKVEPTTMITSFDIHYQADCLNPFTTNLIKALHFVILV